MFLRPSAFRASAIVTLLLLTAYSAFSLPKDSQTTQILEATINASGGISAIQSLKTLRTSGEISYNWGLSPLSGTATISLMGTTACRFEMNVPEHERSWYAVGRKGKIRENGKTKALPLHATVGCANFAVPILTLATATYAANYDVSFVGTENDGGRTLLHIRVEKHPGSESESEDDKWIDSLENTEYYIAQQSMLIVKISNIIHPLENQSIDQHHAIDFSEFHPVNGVQIPYSIVEHVENAQVWSLHLSEAVLNENFSKADLEF